MLYVDRWLVAVNKPSGEIVHRGWARDDTTTMSRTRDALGTLVHPVHRLDRGTSGVILFARDRDTLRAVADTWAQATKRYFALVRGTPADSGTIDHPVKRGEKGPERVPAVTHYRRLGVSTIARCSLVEALPETGRLHQIRRHFKHISHPLIGDVRYGKGDVNRAFRSDHDLYRLALHAASLKLRHPVTGQTLRIEAPIPEDLLLPLDALGLRASLSEARAETQVRS